MEVVDWVIFGCFGEVDDGTRFMKVLLSEGLTKGEFSDLFQNFFRRQEYAQAVDHLFKSFI